MKIRGPM